MFDFDFEFDPLKQCTSFFDEPAILLSNVLVNNLIWTQFDRTPEDCYGVTMLN